MLAHDIRAAFSGQGAKRALERRRTLSPSTIEVPRRAGTKYQKSRDNELIESLLHDFVADTSTA